MTRIHKAVFLVAGLAGAAGAGFSQTYTTFTTIYSFTGAADGAGPIGPLVQSTDGNFYGATSSTIFKITPAGSLTTLYTFNSADDAYPSGRLPLEEDGLIPNGLTLGTDGNF